MSSVKAFTEQQNHLKIMIESMTKFSRSYTLPMKDKSTFNIISPLFQGVWILYSEAIDHLTPFVKMTREQLITVANGDSVPIF